MDAEDGDLLNKSIDDDENKDDKLWADVDKDLGDILADVEDDDEEESNLKTKERYDRLVEERCIYFLKQLQNILILRKCC